MHDSKITPPSSATGKPRAPRDSMLLAGTITRSGEDASRGFALRVRNLSATGVMGDCSVTFEAGDAVDVALSRIGVVPGMVAWAKDGQVAVTFDLEIDPRQARRRVLSKPPSWAS